MAEVGSEEISSFNEVVVGGDILSFSPFALSGAFGIVSLNAFVNESDIAIHEHWSAEVMIWDQISTVAIDARSWAGTSWHVKASLPLSWRSILVSTLWVAELLGEERFLHWSEVFPGAHISRQAGLFSFEVKALHGAGSSGSSNIIAGASWWARVATDLHVKEWSTHLALHTTWWVEVDWISASSCWVGSDWSISPFAISQIGASIFDSNWGANISSSSYWSKS
jgi:hypothetical protein